MIMGALISSSLTISAVMGIMGVITLWDSLEFSRQQRRVTRGHAPANPNNPRHRQILAEYPSATRIRWLIREPVGRQIPAEEQNAIREANK